MAINPTYSQFVTPCSDEASANPLTQEEFLSKLIEAIKIDDKTSIDLLHNLGLKTLNEWAVLFCAYFADYYKRPDLAKFYQTHFANTWPASAKLKEKYNRAQKTCSFLARLHPESKRELF